MDLSSNTSATGTRRSGAATGLSSTAMATNPGRTPRGCEGCFFVSNVFYFVHRLKNYTQKTTNQRVAKIFSTYYVPYVSFCLKSACNHNPAMNPAMTPPPKPGKPPNFFTKLSGNLSWTHRSGVGQKNGVGGPLASSTKLLGKMQNTLTNENLNFEA